MKEYIHPSELDNQRVESDDLPESEENRHSINQNESPNCPMDGADLDQMRRTEQETTDLLRRKTLHLIENLPDNESPNKTLPTSTTNEASEVVTQENQHNFPEGTLCDKNGDPLILFRGSSLALSLNKEQRYSPDLLGHSTEAPSAGEAFFFTDRKKTARYYARGNNPNLESAVRSGGDPHVDNVHLVLKNPYIHDFKGNFYRGEETTYYNLLLKARQEGHDGVIFKNTFDGGEHGRFDALMRGRLKSENIYCVFDSEQVSLQSTESLITPKKKEKILSSGKRQGF